jgi:flagellar motor switch protein FliN/FliY
MSTEQGMPSSGGQPGDVSEQELRKILGDDYEAVVASGAAATPRAVDPEDALVGAGAPPAGATEPSATEADLPQAGGEDAPGGINAGSDGRGSGAEAWMGEGAPVRPVHFAQLDEAGVRQEGSIDVLLDVKLPISVELGRTEMLVKEILDCGPGTVIELNKLAGEPVDVFINGRMVAQGEVVVVDEHFGVRVTNLLSPRDRVRSLA